MVGVSLCLSPFCGFVTSNNISASPYIQKTKKTIFHIIEVLRGCSSVNILPHTFLGLFQNTQFISISTAQKSPIAQYGLLGCNTLDSRDMLIFHHSTSFQMTLQSLIVTFCHLFGDHWLIIADNVINDEPLFKWHQMSTELCLQSYTIMKLQVL